jgi:hypothetical protein
MTDQDTYTKAPPVPDTVSLFDEANPTLFGKCCRTTCPSVWRIAIAIATVSHALAPIPFLASFFLLSIPDKPQ